MAVYLLLVLAETMGLERMLWKLFLMVKLLSIGKEITTA
jgi:hypothetical protein